MLPIQNRLTKKDDFHKVFQRGNFFSFGNTSLKVIKNNLNETRIGFLVGKKLLRKASERNKTKRLLKGCFLKYIKKIKKGHDIVVFCRISKENILNKYSCETINKLLRKSKLLIKSKNDD